MTFEHYIYLSFHNYTFSTELLLSESETLLFGDLFTWDRSTNFNLYASLMSIIAARDSLTRRCGMKNTLVKLIKELKTQNVFNNRKI